MSSSGDDEEASHRCEEWCRCTSAQCQVCFDLRWSLLEDPDSAPEMHDAPEISVRIPDLDESARRGCRTCDVVFQSIKSLVDYELDLGDEGYEGQVVLKGKTDETTCVTFVEPFGSHDFVESTLVELYTVEGKCPSPGDTF
jgi:hypothetical protein